MICETVIIEEQTRNLTLVNCFSRVSFRSLPTSPYPLSIYTVLADGSGDATIKVVVTLLESDEELFGIERSVRFRDRLSELKLIFRLKHLVFPEAGTYQFALFVDGEWLTQRNINVLLRENLS
jgi:hypothetical protein